MIWPSTAKKQAQDAVNTFYKQYMWGYKTVEIPSVLEVPLFPVQDCTDFLTDVLPDVTQMTVRTARVVVYKGAGYIDTLRMIAELEADILVQRAALKAQREREATTRGAP